MRRVKGEVLVSTVGFVSCVELGGITPDDELIASALAENGIRVEPVFWDDGSTLARHDALVLRSPWNYHLDHHAFLAWVDDAAGSSSVFNDGRLVRWNAHKGYLFDLERGGIKIVETILCKKHEARELRAIMTEHKWPQAIVKPAISASSFMTGIVGLRTHADRDVQGRVMADGQHLLDSILETRDALIQPFLPQVFERGERCLIFIEGRFSHAVGKAPFTDVGGGGRVVIAERREIDIGERALSLLPQKPLYARIDLLRGADGEDRLMELELIDPELYMRLDARAPVRFAAALARRMTR
ncbi:MAG TPA: hypothetical protein VIJ12_10625 [Candidatus Baltobacteraceae bacterium]